MSDRYTVEPFTVRMQKKNKRRAMNQKEVHDELNDLLKKFWSLNFSDTEVVEQWFEEWGELTDVLRTWAANWRETDTPRK